MAARRALRAQQRTRNTLCSSAGCAQDVVAVKAATAYVTMTVEKADVAQTAD